MGADHHAASLIAGLSILTCSYQFRYQQLKRVALYAPLAAALDGEMTRAINGSDRSPRSAKSPVR